MIAEEADRPAAVFEARESPDPTDELSEVKEAAESAESIEPNESATPRTDPNQTEHRAIWWHSGELHVSTAPFRARQL